MPPAPKPVAAFLEAKRIAVAGVSRAGNTPANAIFRKLAETGHEVIPVNPNASEIEGHRCYPSIAAVDGQVDAVMVVTHPSVSGGVEPIEGGCPLMYCQPVDPAHWVFRWWLRLQRRVPG